MNTLLGPRLFFLLAVAAPVILALQPANVDAQTQSARPSQGPTARTTEKEKMNAWTVGLAGGLLEGAPIRLAAEIARVVDDGPNMHVLPIVTRGATENLNSLLYLRGVDMAIINSDALEEYKIQVPTRSKSTRFRYRRSGVASPTCSISSRRNCISSFDRRLGACRTSLTRK